jgi:hypothetical protein
LLAPVPYATGITPQAVATGHFNNDAALDLVVANAGGNSLSVLFGNGDGTFQPALDSPTAAGPRALAVADFNQDGHRDVATAHPTGVQVLLGNGAGTFTPSAFIDFTGIGTLPQAVGVGDFNGDGATDLAVTADTPFITDYYGGSANIILGDGQGNFGSVTTFGVFYRSNRSAVVADFSRDGRLDVASVDSAGFVNILHGNGSGGFLSHEYRQVSNTRLYSLAVGDLDGDGRLDTVAAEHSTLRVGNGWPYAVATGPAFVHLSDFNGDGVPDAVAAGAGASAVSVLLGRGTDPLSPGSFEPREDFAAGAGPAGVATGDFNGDGRADAVTVNPAANTVSVLLNDGNWFPMLRITDVDVVEGHTGTRTAAFTVSLSNASSLPVTVTYQTANGTAAAGSDYQAQSGTLTFAPGEVSKTVTVTVTGDRAAEANETFFVNLSSPVNATLAETQGRATILDDEPRITIGDVTRAEGRSGITQFTFTITLSAAYDQAVSVSFRTVDGTAKASTGDYTARSGTLTFNPGETTMTVTVDVKGDSKKEANETFFLELYNPSVNLLISRNRGLGTILNDD